jgi:hypothetical protein
MQLRDVFVEEFCCNHASDPSLAKRLDFALVACSFHISLLMSHSYQILRYVGT